MQGTTRHCAMPASAQRLHWELGLARLIMFYALPCSPAATRTRRGAARSTRCLRSATGEQSSLLQIHVNVSITVVFGSQKYEVRTQRYRCGLKFGGVEFGGVEFAGGFAGVDFAGVDFGGPELLRLTRKG